MQHPAFAGHFPGAPIVPGVVLLDTALQAIAVAESLLLDQYELSSVKFLSPLSPADSEN
jgi:3-hydroxyacyl-[acyl-carrier-protein] dehydratase